MHPPHPPPIYIYIIYIYYFIHIMLYYMLLYICCIFIYLMAWGPTRPPADFICITLYNIILYIILHILYYVSYYVVLYFAAHPSPANTIRIIIYCSIIHLLYNIIICLFICNIYIYIYHIYMVACAANPAHTLPPPTHPPTSSRFIRVTDPSH